MTIIYSRMIHSPTQLTSMDQSIREAQQAFETVTTWKKDFHTRWKDLERMFRVSFRIKEVYRESRNSPHNQSVGDRQSDHGSTNTAIRQGTKFFRKLSAVSEFSAILNNNRSIGKLWCLRAITSPRDAVTFYHVLFHWMTSSGETIT